MRTHLSGTLNSFPKSKIDGQKYQEETYNHIPFQATKILDSSGHMHLGEMTVEILLRGTIHVRLGTIQDHIDALVYVIAANRALDVCGNERRVVHERV